MLVLARVAEAVPEEMHRAALPGTAEHLRDRLLEPCVGIGYDELHASQPACHERAHELTPERRGLGLADVDPEDLAAARLVNAVGDHDRLADDPAAVSDLLDLRVEPQVGVLALERPLSERLDLLVEQRADARDLRARDAQPE